MAFCTNCGSAVEGSFCVKCGKPAGSGAPAPPLPASAPQQPSATQPRKRTSPLVWILVAVVGLFVLVGVALVGAGIFVVHKAKQAGLDPALLEKNPALAVTKLLAATNPDVEVLRVDEGRGLITLKEKSTGKTVTVDFDAIKKGRISFHEEGKPPVTMEAQAEGESGSFQIRSGKDVLKFGSGSEAKVPAWVPTYPGASPQDTVSMQGSGGEHGSFHFVTKDSPKSVATFFEGALKQAGFQIVLHQAGESGEGMVMAEHPSLKRTMMVTTGADGDGTAVNVVFGVKQ